MAAMNSSSRCVVRCETSWTARAVLCTIALVATGAAAYRMGINRTIPAARYMATATIHHGLRPSDGRNAHPSIEPEPLNAAEVKRRIVSRESLHRVLGRMGMAGSDVARGDLSGSGGGAVDRIGERVSVTATETLLPPGLRISVACTDEDPDRVVRLANALAEDYRDQYRARREIQFGRKRDEALAAAERARQRFLKAQGRFDDFVGQHFHKQEALAERLPKLVDPLPSVDPVNMREPGKTGDLERAELERELAELKERRRELLLTRTSAHPAVSVMEVQIGGLQHRLASMPMETPSGEELSWPHEKEPLRTEVADPDYAATAQEFRARKETLDQERREYDQASALQRGTRERRSHDAKIEVELADTSQMIGPSAASPAVMLVALIAGLAVAAGVGLIQSGFDTDPPLESLEQAETAMPVPIVGVIPAADGTSDRVVQQPSRLSGGVAKVISGISLVAVSFGFLVLVF